MIDKLLFKIADWHNNIMRKKGIINDENYSDKDYFFRGNLYNILSTFIMLIIGLCIGCFYEFLMLCIVLNILRAECGGYHSYGNLTFCLIVSLVIFAFAALFSKYYCGSLIPIIIITVLSILYILINTPKINLEYDNLIKDKWCYKVDFFIYSTLFFLVSFIMPRNIQLSIYMAIIIIVPFMSDRVNRILNKIRNLIFK